MMTMRRLQTDNGDSGVKQNTEEAAQSAQQIRRGGGVGGDGVKNFSVNSQGEFLKGHARCLDL